MTAPAPLVVLVAPDKFRSTATARQAAGAICRGVALAGLALPGGSTCTAVPLADGGEGTVDALGGSNQVTVVVGPLGEPVSASWLLDGERAVIEMAAASGLALVGGVNDPVGATTRGTGELIAAAIAAGARQILIGVGGSATTEGGAGALEVLAPGGRCVVPDGVRLTVAADVRTRFTDAARVFGPQKGADPGQVALLTSRLEGLRAEYLSRFGVDVGSLDRSGAAGGLAGGLAAIGAELVDGFTAVADAAGLSEKLVGADVVVTGEGRFDATSLDGKVVGGVIERAAGRPVLVVCGSAEPGLALPANVTVVSLVEEFGEERAFAETESCLTEAVRRALPEFAHAASSLPRPPRKNVRVR